MLVSSKDNMIFKVKESVGRILTSSDDVSERSLQNSFYKEGSHTLEPGHTTHIKMVPQMNKETEAQVESVGAVTRNAMASVTLVYMIA